MARRERLGFLLSLRFGMDNVGVGHGLEMRVFLYPACWIIWSRVPKICRNSRFASE